MGHVPHAVTERTACHDGTFNARCMQGRAPGRPPKAPPPGTSASAMGRAPRRSTSPGGTGFPISPFPAGARKAAERPSACISRGLRLRSEGRSGSSQKPGPFLKRAGFRTVADCARAVWTIRHHACRGAPLCLLFSGFKGLFVLICAWACRPWHAPVQAKGLVHAPPHTHTLACVPCSLATGIVHIVSHLLNYAVHIIHDICASCLSIHEQPCLLKPAGRERR